VPVLPDGVGSVRWAPAIVTLCLLCGCGGSDAARPVATVDDVVSPAQASKPVTEVAEPLPTRAALEATPGAGLRAQLDGGAVAVVDLEGRMGIRPGELTFAGHGRLEELEWSRWDDGGAEATGRMRGVLCQPTCAQGEDVDVRASIRLSKPVACPAGRFFDRGEVVARDRSVESTSWLAAPC
jgi:hypothetical protein